MTKRHVAAAENANESRSKRNVKNYTMAIAVRLTGVESHRIRRFEEGGLLNPERTAGNQRLFSEDDVDIVKQVASLEDEGINMEGVKAILAIRRGERK